MKRSHKSNISRHIKTTWRLSSSVILRLSDFNATIRAISKSEAEELNEEAQKNNSFIRYPYGNPFYPLRILNLSDKTVIEIFRPGRPSDIGNLLDSLSTIIEIVVLALGVLLLTRAQFQKRLAIGNDIGKDYDITIGPSYKSFRSKSKRDKTPKGILIDDQFVSCFHNNGFVRLLHYCQSNAEMSQRVVTSLNWLIDSMQEASLTAAFVKTSIALESLLIFNDNEPLSRSLSERCAYVLSSYPDTRRKVAKIVRDFYDARSGIVHGGRKKSDLISPKLLDLVNRILILTILILSANEKKWSTKDELREWCESQKWDVSDIRISRPFNDKFIKCISKYQN